MTWSRRTSSRFGAKSARLVRKSTRFGVAVARVVQLQPLVDELVSEAEQALIRSMQVELGQQPVAEHRAVERRVVDGQLHVGARVEVELVSGLGIENSQTASTPLLEGRNIAAGCRGRTRSSSRPATSSRPLRASREHDRLEVRPGTTREMPVDARVRMDALGRRDLGDDRRANPLDQGGSAQGSRDRTASTAW